MRRPCSYLSLWETGPLEEGDGAPGASLLIRIEEVAMVDVILIDSKLDPAEAKDLRVKAAINQLT